MLQKLYPEINLVKFNRRQDRLMFFSIVNELVKPDHIVLDLGAGRNRFPEYGWHLEQISSFKGRCKSLIGVDVDQVVLQNDSLDEAHVIDPTKPIPVGSGSVDLIFSYAVLEHLDDPEAFAAEVSRILKPGGTFCAWTPNKWGYIGLGARLIPNRYHAKLLNTAQPNSRGEKDVFPTRYKFNTMKCVKKFFDASKFENFSFEYNAQPSYNFGSSIIARFWLVYMFLMPKRFSQSLMIFVRKK